jgi:hypothetical protein
MLLSIVSTLALTACGSNNNGGSATPVPGVGGGPGSAITTCQVGQIYHSSYGCMNQYNCPSGQGYAANVGCVAGTVVTSSMIYGGAYSTRLGGTISITNTQLYKNMLMYSGMCGQNISWLSYNIGYANCDSWMNGAALILESFDSTGMVNMRIQSGGNWTTGYSSMSLSSRGTVKPYNNSAGMVVLGVAYTGQDNGLRVISENGTMNSSTASVTLTYQGATFATGTIQRF